MSIHILQWIKEDLEKLGKELSQFTMLELQDMLQDYNNKYNR